MGKRRNWKKIEDVVKQTKELGLNLKEGAERFGIKVEDIYEFNRKSSEAVSEVGDEPVDASGAGSSKIVEESSLPEDIQQLIIDYRRKNPDHGFKRISDELKGKHLVVVNRKQIRKVLKAHGLLEVLDSSFDRTPKDAKGTRRFEADCAGDLYQMDVSYIYLTGIPVLYLIIIVDDHSRFCVGADLCHDQRGETLISVLHNTCTLHGFPRKLLTDQGSGFYTWSERQTVFQEYLDDHKVEHIVADAHSPQTQGKIERLIQSVKRELFSRVRFRGYDDARQGVMEYVRSYNFDRPHQGIGGFRPADRFYGVLGERSRIESELLDKRIDFSKGYLIFKVQDRSVSVVCAHDGIQVFLDGKLLQEIKQ